METLVGSILQVGVLLSAALLATGLLWHWAATGSFQLDYTLAGRSFFLFLVADLQQALLGTFRPRLLVSLGIATLLFTPYLRVAASFVYFALVARDAKYMMFTGFVWAVLTYSLFLR
jgi:uncharacterized membrane protein